MNNGILESAKPYQSYPLALLGNSVPVSMPDDFWHPDAQNWRSRVISNGGTVTLSTMNAVSNFCRRIDRAMIRNKFYRLNLFCGDNLNACLVPLYLGPSLSSRIYGNLIDTNVGFVSADYQSTGTRRGLKGNAIKYLRTGLAPSDIDRYFHIGAHASWQNPTHAFRFIMGAGQSANVRETALAQWVNNGQYSFYNTDNSYGISASVWPPPFFLLGSLNRTSVEGQFSYVAPTITLDGTVTSRDNVRSSSPATFEFFIFDINRAGSSTGGSFGSTARLTYYSIGSSLTSEETQALRQAVIQLNEALNVSIPTVSNIDAQSWINRVYDNGGEVSLSTASSVNQFCNEIDAAGLRDRFVRLNLFCGSNLNASLVPLYRATSLSATQLGNSTDANVNFVSSDYNERGNLAGLQGNGTGSPTFGGNKYLNTGLQPSSIGLFSGHLATYVYNFNNSGANQQTLMGIRDNTVPAQRWWLDYRTTAIIADYSANNFTAMTTPASTTSNLVMVNRQSATLLQHYIGSTQIGSDYTTDITSTAVARARNFFIFALNVDGGPGTYSGFRQSLYSIGLGMTPSQVTSFNNAVNSFNISMGRL